MKVLCNITWRCTLSDCKYCWIYGQDGVGAGFVEQQTQGELNASQWIEGLNRLPARSIIDFCGGEPTILGEDLVSIISSLPLQLYGWGLTTNLATDQNVEVIERLYGMCGSGCVSLNCSYHHGVPLNEWLPRFRKVWDMYGKGLAKINIINSPFHFYGKEVRHLQDLGYEVNYEPYQNPRDGNNHSPVLWKCSAGISHIVICPNGDVFSCLCAFRSDRRVEYKIGSLLGGIHHQPPKELCDLNCDPIEAKCWQIFRVEKGRNRR